MNKPNSLHLQWGSSQPIGIGAFAVSIKPQDYSDSTSDATIYVGDSHVFEADFLEVRWASEAQGLAPTLDFVRLEHNEQTACVLLGVYSWLIVGRSNVIDRVSLNRSKDDDRGFYDVEWTLAAPNYIFVYEGGVVVLSLQGKVVWHKAKRWDEVVTRVTSQGVEVLGEENQKRFISSATTEKV